MGPRLLYVAGPMSGYPEFNYPSFLKAEAQLREAGYRVLNPATNPACDSWEGYMRAALLQLMKADGIAALPDWQLSAGAALEVTVAHALRIPTLAVTRWIETAP